MAGWSDWLPTLLGSVGFGALAGAMVQGFFARPKVAAEASKAEHEGDAVFAAAVNARVTLMIDGLSRQIAMLQDRLAAQEKDCQEREVRQLEQIERLENEVRELRQALDKRPLVAPGG